MRHALPPPRKRKRAEAASNIQNNNLHIENKSKQQFEKSAPPHPPHPVRAQKPNLSKRPHVCDGCTSQQCLLPPRIGTPCCLPVLGQWQLKLQVLIPFRKCQVCLLFACLAFCLIWSGQTWQCVGPPSMGTDNCLNPVCPQRRGA